MVTINSVEDVKAAGFSQSRIGRTVTIKALRVGMPESEYQLHDVGVLEAYIVSATHLTYRMRGDSEGVSYALGAYQFSVSSEPDFPPRA